jgi:hypothetical protein
MADTRFHLIFDATADELVDVPHAFATDAMAAAQNIAIERIGHTIIVFEPKEAFRAAAVTNKVWLTYPERDQDRPKAQVEQPADDLPTSPVEEPAPPSVDDTVEF